jgi:uncharacterized membrane protein
VGRSKAAAWRDIMGFWIYMFIMDILIPLTMLGIGRAFLKKAPEKINTLLGYRTTMSMKNMDTWDFAHKYCGRLWYVCGLTLLPVSAAVMIFIAGKSERMVGTVGGILCMVQIMLMLFTVCLTEKALKQNFDKDGKRR